MTQFLNDLYPYMILGLALFAVGSIVFGEIESHLKERKVQKERKIYPMVKKYEDGAVTLDRD